MLSLGWEPLAVVPRAAMRVTFYRARGRKQDSAAALASDWLTAVQGFGSAVPAATEVTRWKPAIRNTRFGRSLLEVVYHLRN